MATAAQSVGRGRRANPLWPFRSPQDRIISSCETGPSKDTLGVALRKAFAAGKRIGSNDIDYANWLCKAGYAQRSATLRRRLKQEYERGMAASDGKAESAAPEASSGVQEEVLSALTNLGAKSASAKKAVAQAVKEGLTDFDGMFKRAVEIARIRNPRQRLISLTTDRRGGTVAYRVDFEQMRNFRIPLAKARQMLETGEAREVPFRRFGGDPTELRVRGFPKPPSEHEEPGFIWGSKFGPMEENPDGEGGYYAVWSPDFNTKAEAERLARELRRWGLKAEVPAGRRAQYEHYGYGMKSSRLHPGMYHASVSVPPDSGIDDKDILIAMSALGMREARTYRGEDYTLAPEYDAARARYAAGYRKLYARSKGNPDSGSEISAAAQVAAEEAQRLAPGSRDVVEVDHPALRMRLTIRRHRGQRGMYLLKIKPPVKKGQFRIVPDKCAWHMIPGWVRVFVEYGG